MRLATVYKRWLLSTLLKSRTTSLMIEVAFFVDPKTSTLQKNIIRHQLWHTVQVVVKALNSCQLNEALWCHNVATDCNYLQIVTVFAQQDLLISKHNLWQKGIALDTEYCTSLANQQFKLFSHWVKCTLEERNTVWEIVCCISQALVTGYVV